MFEVLIDTAVWIDSLGGRQLPNVLRLRELIEADDNLCVCGVILTEVLQGIRSDGDYRKTKGNLESLIFLPMLRSTFVRAADLYRSLRKNGVTILESVDCLIAAAIEYCVPLLHNDRDFDWIAAHSKLRVLEPNEGGRCRTL